jgi:hypothetical protein
VNLNRNRDGFIAMATVAAVGIMMMIAGAAQVFKAFYLKTLGQLPAFGLLYIVTGYGGRTAKVRGRVPPRHRDHGSFWPAA